VKIRQLLVALAAASLGTTASEAAVIYSFEGADAGGIGSATIETEVITNIFQVRIKNTSPTTLVGGSGDNAPGITGFGFSFENAVTIKSWDLFALNAGGFLGEIGVSGAACSDSNPWVMDLGSTNVPLDFFVSTCPGSTVKGALYNPNAPTKALGGPPQFFTGNPSGPFVDGKEALLRIFFDGAAPIVDVASAANCGPNSLCSPFVRMQNVGDEGSGSLKLGPGGPLPPQGAPEPGTLALLGMAIVAGALAKRKVRG
jgi:hypothetical protein